MIYSDNGRVAERDVEANLLACLSETGAIGSTQVELGDIAVGIVNRIRPCPIGWRKVNRCTRTALERRVKGKRDRIDRVIPARPLDEAKMCSRATRPSLNDLVARTAGITILGITHCVERVVGPGRVRETIVLAKPVEVPPSLRAEAIGVCVNRAKIEAEGCLRRRAARYEWRVKRDRHLAGRIRRRWIMRKRDSCVRLPRKTGPVKTVVVCSRDGAF